MIIYIFYIFSNINNELLTQFNASQALPGQLGLGKGSEMLTACPDSRLDEPK
jgi:hypothetical protein